MVRTIFFIYEIRLKSNQINLVADLTQLKHDKIIMEKENVHN